MGVYNTLDGCLPDLVTAYGCLTQAAAGLGVSFQINDYGGLRNAAITAELMQFRQSDYNAAITAGQIPAGESIDVFRPIAEYGESFHDYGAAFDVSPIAWPSGSSYEDAVQTLGSLAFYCGLRWPLPSSDPAHFELDIALGDAQAEYATYTGTAIADNANGTDTTGPLLALGAAIAVLAWWYFSRGPGRQGGPYVAA